MLVPADKLHIEFYTVTAKKKREKLIAIFDLLLESLMSTRYIDLSEENLSNSNNHLMKSTIQMKLYYTPPTLEREETVLNINDEDASTIDWNARFDDDGRHGGHRSRYIRSKNNNNSVL